MVNTKGLFFISDYRDVTCIAGRDPSYWILNALNRQSKFDVYSTVNSITNEECFENIQFLPSNFGGDINIQHPQYNYSLYSSYTKVRESIKVIHHCEKFQYERGYNLIPLLSGSDLKNKSLIIGPIQFPHKVFENDYLVGKKGVEQLIHKSIFKTKPLLGYAFKRLFISTISSADKLIVPNTYVKDSLKKYVPEQNIEIINYGVNLSLYRDYVYSAKENNFKIVYPSMAIERKGVEYLLDAVSILKKDYPSVELYLLSNGYLLEHYRDLSEELGIAENVFFCGTMNKERYLNFISNCRLLCLPTLSEGYGWTILDAMCLGVPVVTTDQCACPELFDNGSIGYMVKSGSSSELAKSISKMFDDYGKCLSFSQNGLKKREQYDYQRIVGRYLQLYDELM